MESVINTIFWIIAISGIVGFVIVFLSLGFAFGDKDIDLVINDPVNYDEDVSLIDYGRVFKTSEVIGLMTYVKERFKLNNKQFDVSFIKVRNTVFANADKKLDDIKRIVEESASNDNERSLYAFLYKCAIMDYKRIDDEETESK
jgi:hypothetical protein